MPLEQTTYGAEIAKLSQLPAKTSFILQWDSICTDRPEHTETDMLVIGR